MKLFGEHTRQVAERIVDAFREPAQLPQALAPVFIRRRDDVPCRKWSWHNQLIAALCGTQDARGIKQWNTVGRKVREGCHAIWILAPCLKKVKEEKHGEEKERQILYGFKSIPVFAVEDTEGDPLPEVDQKYDTWVDGLPLMEVAQEWGIQVGTYTHGQGNPLGYYRYGGDGKAIMLGVENLSTFTHELVHAADHRIGGLREAAWHKEIVAELGGAILLECLGKPQDADLGGAFQYIEGYAREANKDTVGACIEVLNRTCNCVRLILDTAEQRAAQQKVA
jgi:hypothetical protein